MRRVNLFQSSGGRVAIAFSLIFLLAAIIAVGTAFSVINSELVTRHGRVLAEDYNVIASAFQNGGQSDLVETVAMHSAASRNFDSVYLLQDITGAKLAGNIDHVPHGLSGASVPARELGINADFAYFLKQGKVGTYVLSVGSSAEDISELEEIFVSGSLWAVLVLASVSFGGAVLLSRRMNRRVEVIQSALHAVADGRFDRRIPMTGRGDDIDVMSTMMNATLARLGASVESIRQISVDISHDLKTPLNHLQILVERALDKQAHGKPIQAELEEASAETSRIIGTFDALLRISQIESGARKSRFTAVDLADVVSGISDFYLSLAEDEGCSIQVALDRPAMIDGDRELLAQLFANLIENALRHCPKGSCIDCSVVQGPGGVVASVCDNGPGIPASERKNVTRRLYRLEKSRTTPGSGLGLAMVKAIAELHSATLELSDNQPGLCVRLRLPAPG